MRKIIIVLAVAAFTALPARAAEPGNMTWGQVESNAMTAWVGRFQPDSSQPAAKGNGYAYGFGGERRLRSGLRYGFEVNVYAADYQTPTGLSCGLFCAFDSTMSLDIVGLGARVGYGTRLGRADLYAGAGLGFYISTMTSSAFIFGEKEERDTDLGVDLRAGISFNLGGKHSLGIELRRLSLNGNFGALSSGRNMPIGGKFVLATYGQHF